MTATAPPLEADLVAGLKRLQLAHFRAVAAETLQTATTQRWTPEALLRALISTEVTGRNAANLAARLKAAGFPVAKSFDDFQVAASSVPPATVDYVASLEWLRARENLCLIGPAGTGKSHLLVAAGQAAVLAGFKVQVHHRRRSGRDALPRTGRQHRRQGHRSACCATTPSWSTSWASRRWTTSAPSCSSASSRPPTSAAAWASPATGRSTSGGASSPSRARPPRCWTACSITPSSSSPRASRSA